MAIDFNTEPFFDDYSEDNKFYRVLFRPGYAVQARELTQLQTILQEQVRRHGDHIFKEGSMVVPGQISYDTNLSYVKLVTDVNVDITAILDELVGKEIKNSAGLIAKVVTYSLAETVDGELQPNTLFVKYQNAVQDQAGNNVNAYSPGDSLTAVDGTAGLNVIVADIEGLTPPIGLASSATIQRGIYYIKKNFVLVTDQTIILDKYSNSPTYRVGLKLVESIVLPEDDESLLDNALGSPNYAAPGAARYKIDLVLTKIAEDANQVTIAEETDFVDLLRLRNGEVIFRIDRSTYAEIEKTLARRTYDESGDYTLSPFNIQVKNYRNNLRGSWVAGERYIQGDIIKVSTGGTGSWYFVATTSGAAGATQPNWANYANVDSFVDNTISWEYVVYPAFNNGVYTFAAGDQSFSEFTLSDHVRLDGMLAYCVEAGKAYVRGYEVEKISTEFLPAQKSRYLPAGSAALCDYFGVDTLPAVEDALSSSKTASIDLSMGSYIVVNVVSYVPNLTSLPQFKLHSVTKNSATDADVIGYARIRAIEKHDVAGQYKLFLFDIKMNTGKEFKDVKGITSLTNPLTNFSCNPVQQDNRTVLQNPGQSGLIWEIPDYAIAEISEVSYSVVAPLTGTASAGSLTLPPPTGYAFESVNDSDNYIVCDNSTGTIVDNPSLAISGNNLVITGIQNQSHTVLATVRRSDAVNAQARRTLTDSSGMQLNTQAAAQAKTITLNHSYVTRIVSVMMSTAAWGTASPAYSIDITNRYEFDFAQDTSMIGLSKITLQSSATPPTGPILIKYEYLSSVENTPGDFLGVGSYMHSSSRIRYDQIPAISSYPLRDCIDFRPYQVGAGFQTRYFPKFGSTGSFKYRHHLTRIDNVSLSSAGSFVVSKGIPALNPIEPNIPANCMKLAQISIEPYTFLRGDQLGAVVNRVENKRYTMRDIGKLERRIQDLEYYTSLTLTELDTKNMRIVDSQGFDRYQNGFLVDTFDGQGIGNAASDDWNASIDSTNKELRPFFAQKQVSLVENVDSEFAKLSVSSKYKVSGDIVTLPFSEAPMIIQNKASMTENVNPYALYTWKGVMEINPWSDTWFSTHYRPDIILNDESQYNAIVAKAEADGVLGTVWNSWQVAFSSTKSLGSRLKQLGAWSTANTEILNSSNNGGTFWRNRATFTAEEMVSIGGVPGNLNTGVAGSRVLTIETTAVETTSTRAGTRSFIVDKVDSRVLEDRVVDTRIVPYIRPRAVLFTGYGFKPSVKMYGFFDNTMVNDYITPAVRLEVVPIAKQDGSFYPSQFDVSRNAGSAVSTNPARAVYYNDGADISGTVTLTNGSDTVTGLATAFTQQVQVGDFLNVGTTTKYKVTAITNNYTLTISPAYSGTTSEDVSVKVIGPNHTTEEVEIAFNHGEVIREVGGNGNTAIVVGQEVFGSKYYIYVLNIKGTGVFSTSADAYLEGEYEVSGTKPRVKFVDRTDFSSLTTSDTGLLSGIFRIPSNPILKFRTGTRELRFSDSAANTPAVRATQESTSASAFYEAKGLVEVMQRTIVSTRTANIVSEQVSATNTIVTTNDRLTRDTGWYDPLAQTFLVQEEGGAFITSVDLFFATRDAKIPVRVEIREVVNGYPGSVVLPFSRVEMKASQVNVDPSYGEAVTKFKFVSPVFLQNGVEYALVVLSDSNSYRVWVSQTDTIAVSSNPAERIRISSQPYNGVLFKSQNGSAWTADQLQDMKFAIHRAEFSQTPVNIEFIPPKLSYKDLAFNPLNFIEGSRKCRIEHKDHGMVTGEYVILKTRQVIESINGISKQYIFDTPLQILSAELDSYVVEFGGTVNSTATGKVGGAYICASENFEFSTAMIEIAEIVPEGTSISYQAKVINHADQISTHAMIPKENTSFDEVKVYPSEANYSSATFPSGLSVIATLNPSPTLKSVSPVIDLGRLAMTMVSNKIDSPDLNINDETLDYFPITPVVDGADVGQEIGEGKALDLIDSNGDGVMDTLVVNSTTSPTLFTNMNNNLNSGDVIRVTYSGITDAIRNMIIVEKSQDDSGNLYFLLEGFEGETVMETTTGQTAVIYWLSHFKSEYAAIGGSAHSKYVTKKINFSRPSEMLKIMFDAVIPNDADVEIYYKTGLSVSGDFISSRYFKAVPNSYTKNSTEFMAIIADVENLAPFDSVMVKLVMKSINKSQVPRIKNFRVIACAA